MLVVVQYGHKSMKVMHIQSTILSCQGLLFVWVSVLVVVQYGHT